MSSRWLRNSFIYLLILVAVIAIVVSFFRGGSSTKNMTVGEVIAAGRDGKLKSIEVSGQSLTVELKNDPQKYASRVGQNTDLEKTLSDNQIQIGGGGDKAVDVKYKAPSQWGAWTGLLVTFLPILVFGAILVFMMRQAQGSNSQAMNFGKSRARMFTGNKPTVTFTDVAGVDEAKEELAEVVEFLKYPEKFAVARRAHSARRAARRTAWNGQDAAVARRGR